jgi:glycosyltransferase 2 family protein
MRAPDTHKPRNLRRWASVAIALAAIGLAAFLLHRNLSQYSFGDIVAAATAVPGWRIAACLAFAGLSYLTLTGFDWLALTHIKRPLRYRYVALTSFTSLSIGHNIGLAALSSGAIRYRFYSRAGLPMGDIAKIIVFCGVTVGLGLMTLGGAALLLNSGEAAKVTGLPRPIVLSLGAACGLLVAAYVALTAYVKRPLRWREWTLELPTPRIALGQVAVGSTNYLFVAACLHQAIKALADVPYLSVAAVYAVANTTALISHAPGGLGVLESVVLHLLPMQRMIGALLVFRLTYFLIPLVIGGLFFAVSEIVLRGKRRGR